MKSIDEMCEIMQASKTKEIESCVLGSDSWSRKQPLWNWGLMDYRVKPKEPRRVWIAHEHSTGEPRWLMNVPDSTLSNAVEYVELTQDVKTKLGMT